MEHAILEQSDAAKLAAKLEQLPMLPGVVARLLALSNSSDRLFEEVMQLANEDPPFAARVIRAANSADSAPASRIENIRDAVARLGGRRIAGLATSMAIARVFVPTTAGQRALWGHSVEVAVAARIICQAQGDVGIDPETAYLAGLLHDIGRFVLLDDSPEQSGIIDESGWETPSELVKAERIICGFDHAEIGWRLCRVWAIPPHIAELIRDHHVFDHDCTSPSADVRPRLVGIIQMADCLSLLMRGEHKIDDQDEQQVIELVETYCVHEGWKAPPMLPEELAACIPAITEESQRIIRDLGLGGDSATE